MADEIVTQIKDALDIVEVVGDSVRLVKKGRNYSGLCPFHDEKTPSFVVSPDRGTWHCFGCGKGGDVFSFVMQKEGLSFPEALELLARRAGIVLPRRGNRPRGEDLYSVMEEAVSFYRSELKGASGAAGRGYLERRGMTMEDADAFELGWAPPSWRALGSALREAGVTQGQMLRCGLVIQGEGGAYDRFRGRLMFPIRNVSGRAIGLGGRIVDGEGAKYLNSPEGPIYSKKDNLYLLDKAKAAIREKGRSILVEGYMDAIRLHMHGHREAVASLGTSLTEEQAALLKRFADRCYICYDADAAGQNAALRGMYVLQRAGLQVFVVQFPGGKDPDEMLQAEGGDALFDKALEDSKPLVLHHISLLGAASEKDGPVKAAQDLLEGMARLPALDLAPYMKELGRAVGLPDYQLERELRRLRESRPQSYRAKVPDMPPAPPAPGGGDDAATEPYDQMEAGIVSLLWNSPELRSQASPEDVLKMLRDDRMQTVALALLSADSPGRLERQWLEMGDTFPMSALAGGTNFCETLPGGDGEKWAALSAELARRSRRERFKALKSLMLRGEATPEDLKEYASLAASLKR